MTTGSNQNSEVGGTAFAAFIGSTSRREILDSFDWIQSLRSPTSCAAKHGTAYGSLDFGSRFNRFRLGSHSVRFVWRGGFVFLAGGSGFTERASKMLAPPCEFGKGV